MTVCQMGLRLLSNCSATQRASPKGVLPGITSLSHLYLRLAAPLDAPQPDSSAFPSQICAADLLFLVNSWFSMQKQPVQITGVGAHLLSLITLLISCITNCYLKSWCFPCFLVYFLLFGFLPVFITRRPVPKNGTFVSCSPLCTSTNNAA